MLFERFIHLDHPEKVYMKILNSTTVFSIDKHFLSSKSAY